MKCVLKIAILLGISYNISLGQIAIEVGSGVDSISQRSYLDGTPNAQFLSIRYGLSEGLGIGMGYRRCSNSSTSLSNFSNESKVFNPYTAGRENGRIDSDEIYLFSSFEKYRFHLRAGLGYVVSQICA